MGRPPCGDKQVAVKKGPWTPEEDIILVSYIQEHGARNWPSVAVNTGLMRCCKSCRLRWTNYLRPGIRRGNFTPHEEGVIVRLQSLLGNRWAAIASYLPQRTDNDIKNHWNTHLKKKLSKQQAIGAIFAPPPPAPSEPASIVLPIAASHDVGCHRQGDSSSSSAYAYSMGNISKLLNGFLMRSPAQDDAYNIKPSSVVTGINNPLLSFDHMSGGGALPPISDVPPQQQQQQQDEEFRGHGGYHDPKSWLFDDEAVDQLMEISDGRCSVPMLL